MGQKASVRNSSTEANAVKGNDVDEQLHINYIDTVTYMIFHYGSSVYWYGLPQ